MTAMASQITSLAIVYSTVYSGADQRKHQSSASLAFVRGIHRWPVNFPHKGPVTRKMFPFGEWNVQSREYRHVDTRLKTGTLLYFTFDDVIMSSNTCRAITRDDDSDCLWWACSWQQLSSLQLMATLTDTGLRQNYSQLTSHTRVRWTIDYYTEGWGGYLNMICSCFSDDPKLPGEIMSMVFINIDARVVARGLKTKTSWYKSWH